MTETILQEAERLINGDRQEQYGNACESLERIADMWNAYIFTTSEPPQSLTAMDVANMMVLLKVSRSKTSLDRSEFHRDSHVDMAGYAGLGGRAWDEIQESLEPKPLTESQWNDVHAATGQPRQWKSFADVPVGVVVEDHHGDKWKHHGWRRFILKEPPFTWSLGSDNAHPEQVDVYGPFTEVLDLDE